MSDNGAFLEYMCGLLGARYAEFKDAYDFKPRYKALRVNTLKISVEEFKALCGYELKPNPLCENSFYCEVKPSLDPLYHAGLYYMQEPSASAAVAAFKPFIGGRVLDLCAAPGGKATQAAAYMNGNGVLFCNDKEYKRARVLVENIERLGVNNAVVTCGTAADYRKAGFDGYFDTVIIDAPCSGGGMTRYEDVPYSREIVSGCAARQREILEDAAALLATGGHLLYSTCTFAKEENEDNVEYLKSLGLETVDIPLPNGVERGIDMPDARRVYPMSFDGEGHFYCVLVKTAKCDACDKPPLRKKKCRVKLNGLELDAVELRTGHTVLPIDAPSTDGLYAVRLSVPVFDEYKEVSHALTHALSRTELELFGTVELGDLAADYIRGKQIALRAKKGSLIATVHGHALGFVKSALSGDGEGVLKNKYPKQLRI